MKNFVAVHGQLAVRIKWDLSSRKVDLLSIETAPRPGDLRCVTDEFVWLDVCVIPKDAWDTLDLSAEIEHLESTGLNSDEEEEVLDAIKAKVESIAIDDVVMLWDSVSAWAFACDSAHDHVSMNSTMTVDALIGMFKADARSNHIVFRDKNWDSVHAELEAARRDYDSEEKVFELANR